eukprot:Ihof_evm15s77 gene=Ihof_evmTU15s77
MSMKVNSYSAVDVTGRTAPVVLERRAVGDKDVLIKIKFCGICHSDLHTINGEWGPVKYPLCPGHEIVGLVEKVGAGVQKYKIGDTVGVGCYVDACGKCDNCVSGSENYCPNIIFTYNHTFPDGTTTQGGYSTHVVVVEEYVLSIPLNLDLAAVAPLLCAGATVYNPLKKLGVKKGDIVGVLGLGGLGHVAVKIASAMGAEVVVVSRGHGKEKEAARLGATKVLISDDKEAIAAAGQSIDYIIDTICASHDLNMYLSLLKTHGTFVSLGLPSTPLPVSFFPMTMRNLTITGSFICGLPDTQEMLDFCGK